MKKSLITTAILAMLGLASSAQQLVPAKDAVKYKGQKVTISDKVFSTAKKNETIILYLGGDSPKQLLTVVIKSSDRSKFKGNPEADFTGKSIYVTGVVVDDKGSAEIFVSSPKQLKLVMIDSPVVKQKF